MALIKCPECGKEVSEFSDNCIGCGYPISKFLAKQKMDEEIISVDIENDCNKIRNIFTEFRNSYVSLSGMKINIDDINEITENFNKKINTLSIEAKREAHGRFVENFCVGLCENTNLDVLNFNEVKTISDIINIDNIPEQNISNITQIIFKYAEKREHAYEIIPLSWLIGQILKIGSEADKGLIESMLRRPDAFGNPLKNDVMEVISELENEITNGHSVEKIKKTDEFVPKCPTCQSEDIKKISVTSKAGSVALWGLFSQKVKKQWHCNNCGSEW